MGTVIDKVDGSVEGYIVGGVIGDVVLAIFGSTLISQIVVRDVKGERVGGTIGENIKITRSLVE